MTKAAALHSFFNGFGIPGYVDTSVPEETGMPYLTYQNIQDMDFNTVFLTVNLWYRTESEATPNAKAREIADAISHTGTRLKCDDGEIWLFRGTPWCQNLTDDTDPAVKRRYLNISAKYLTI